MGTHISRVKSVDLDAWTDEQLQSVLKWGNARANKYWEAKLAPGHVPSEAKIENFIRTKYESKRWVMDGPIPDPSTLDAEGDDDIPLNLVKEKHTIERSASQKAAAAAPQLTGPSSVQRAQQPDIFGDGTEPARRPNTTSPQVPGPAARLEAAPPKQVKPADSLLGLDFFDTEAPPPNRPSSAAAISGAATQSRPDLKQSILSLYASAPRPQQQQQQPSSQTSLASFGGMQSPTIAQQPKASVGGLNDAFSGLSFGAPTSPPAQSPTAKPSAFAGLGNIQSHRSTPSQVSSQSSGFGTGSFFDAKPAQKAPPAPAQHARTFSSSSGFGAFDSAPAGSPLSVAQPAANSGLGDLFDFSSPAPMQAPPKQTINSPSAQSTSVFNLSAPQPPPPPTKAQPTATTLSGWNSTDAWGSTDAWNNSYGAPAKVSPPISKPAPPAQTNSFGWGSSGSLANQSIVPGGGGGFTPASSGPPKVSADEDFGGWSSAAPVTPRASTTSAKPATGFATNEDLFSNVWQ
jgi:stromal membrane-associated protein